MSYDYGILKHWGQGESYVAGFNGVKRKVEPLFAYESRWLVTTEDTENTEDKERFKATCGTEALV